MAVFSFDYLFLDEKGEVMKNGVIEDRELVVKVLVAHDSLCGCVFAHVVPQKGVDAELYAVDILVEDLKWLGYQRVIHKSDNEPAIVKLLRTALTELRHCVEDLA